MSAGQPAVPEQPVPTPAQPTPAAPEAPESPPAAVAALGAATERPEILVGAAFAGGLILAFILRRITS